MIEIFTTEKGQCVCSFCNPSSCPPKAKWSDYVWAPLTAPARKGAELPTPQLSRHLLDASQPPLGVLDLPSAFPVCPLAYCSLSINMICPVLCILQGQAQDSWRFQSLAERLLILIYSGFEILSGRNGSWVLCCLYLQLLSSDRWKHSVEWKPQVRAHVKSLQDRLAMSPLGPGRGKGYRHALYLHFLLSCVGLPMDHHVPKSTNCRERKHR